MNAQLELGHIGPRHGSIEADFWPFHTENPHVYDALARLAREWVARRPGRRLGIGMLFEVLRWQVAMSTTGEDFKLNNSYRSYYARMLMDRERDLAGLFELRRLHAVEPFGGVL